MSCEVIDAGPITADHAAMTGITTYVDPLASSGRLRTVIGFLEGPGR
jgi:hypothetical protein